MINREVTTGAEAFDSTQRVVLDMDSTEIAVYGQQEQSAYNGQFEHPCYHPLLMLNGEGDCVVPKLRPGNVHRAEDWEELLLPEVNRQQVLGKEVVFQADAAFAKPETYEALEARGVKYAIRIPANDSLERPGQRQGVWAGIAGWVYSVGMFGARTEIPVYRYKSLMEANMIRNGQLVRISQYVLLLMMLTMASYAAGQVETIDAKARGTSTQMGKDFDIRVTIDRFSTDEERAALKTAFDKGGHDALVRALSKMKSAGRIRIASTTGFSVAYARSIPTPTGRKVRFLTDRPTAFAEHWNMTRSKDYDVTGGEIEINDQDQNKSTGVLYPAVRIRQNKDGDIEFEAFQNPWRLVNIIDWTPKKK